jgi:hypothetical protein
VSNSAYAVSPLISGQIFDDTGSAALSLLIGGGVSLVGAAVAAVLIPGKSSEVDSEESSQPEVDGIDIAGND